MREFQDIIQAYDTATASGKTCALAAVVHVDGSSYRRPGARMLVCQDGQLTGAISGGCLEGDALRKALHAIWQQQSKLVTYDTSDEEEATVGMQLGCAGIIQVLFEPIQPLHAYHPIQLLRKALAVRQKAVLVTLCNLQDKHAPQPGTCLLLEANGQCTGAVPIEGLGPQVLHHAQLALDQQQSHWQLYNTAEGTISAFIEFIQPPVALMVVGAGNDAIPMMQIAATLGWEVRVADGRTTHAKPNRFAQACQILVSKPEQLLAQLPVDDRTAFVMMTHNYNYDKAMLRALLPLPVPYIGMLGPRKKLERMLQELRSEGMPISPGMLQKVYGPAGHDIGAETAEEIALSIIAEIQAVFQQKEGGSLRQKPGTIHTPIPYPAIPLPL